MTTHTVTLFVKPMGKGRPRFTKAGRTYTPAATASAEQEIRWLLQKEKLPIFEGPVAVTAVFVFEKPKSVKKRIHHTVRPDIDNLMKIVMDSGNKILWFDDAQICSFTVEKNYGSPERIELTLAEIGA